MKNILTSQQRDFAHLVREAIYANPFTRKRHLANCALTGLAATTAPDRVLNKAIEQVQAMVRQLEMAGVTTLPPGNHEERQSMADIFLFFHFHRYLPYLDHHITEQAQTSKSLELACGPSLYANLARHGFTRQERIRYIGLFFQMRRAFFFIRNSLIGEAPCMEALRASLWNTVFTHDITLYEQHLLGKLEDFSTLLLGETGTGKGVAAAAIGRSGFIPYDERKNRFAASFSQAFLAINLCQFPESLLESELFGHTRGAFTGAIADHQGIFARASRYGAVFLDEIGEINEQIQVKLLRILQERTFTPVGSHASSRFAGRLIGATNRNLGELMEQGSFRQDFYFRIATVPVILPPLRQRIRENPDELSQLVRFLVGKIAGSGAEETLAELIEDQLRQQDGQSYSWPGNVRELEQAVRRIILNGTWQPEKREEKKDAIEQVAALTRPPSMAELTASYCRALLKEHRTIQAVARLTGLDRRTVKKYIDRSDA